MHLWQDEVREFTQQIMSAVLAHLKKCPSSSATPLEAKTWLMRRAKDAAGCEEIRALERGVATAASVTAQIDWPNDPRFAPWLEELIRTDAGLSRFTSVGGRIDPERESFYEYVLANNLRREARGH